METKPILNLIFVIKFLEISQRKWIRIAVEDHISVRQSTIIKEKLQKKGETYYK